MRMSPVTRDGSQSPAPPRTAMPQPVVSSPATGRPTLSAAGRMRLPTAGPPHTPRPMHAAARTTIGAAIQPLSRLAASADTADPRVPRNTEWTAFITTASVRADPSTATTKQITARPDPAPRAPW